MTNEETPRSYRDVYAENLIQTELQGVREWYETQLRQLEEMTVVEADLTDGEKWKATLTEKGQVKEVDGVFFTLKGQTVTRYKRDGTLGFQWTQPGVLQKEEELVLPTPDGTQSIRASGIVGIVTDLDENVLLTLAQEPFAKTPKSALVRTPFQTSVTKLKGLMEGKKELDPGLYDVLQEVGGGQNISDVFANGTVETFPLPYADANRIAATNVGFVMRVTSPELHARLEKNGQNRWFSQREVNYTARAGLLNGHTAVAILGARAK